MEDGGYIVPTMGQPEEYSVVFGGPQSDLSPGASSSDLLWTDFLSLSLSSPL